MKRQDLWCKHNHGDACRIVPRIFTLISAVDLTLEFFSPLKLNLANSGGWGDLFPRGLKTTALTSYYTYKY